ncbi:tegument protein UL25 [Saimiriine betaherpesvirus 4]|uniref:Tegument protein UL25 n=1 Tax=Saimiriine betaherpesvirus 4 TaxID=1535247 RepID=G8XST9_9BETA|nr:tegument protein UL25 [Saimiriine betaherpesvirus 4]AEV80886.1 tegument protein UL25 [Saimiriine betaherpesvirus 4]
MSLSRDCRPTRPSIRGFEDDTESIEEVFLVRSTPTPSRDIEQGLDDDWESFNGRSYPASSRNTPVSSFEIINEANVDLRPSRLHVSSEHRPICEPSRHSRHQPVSQDHNPSSDEEDLGHFTFSTSDIEDYETPPINRYLNFDLNVLSLEDIALIENSIYEVSLEQLSRINECKPMPTFILTNLIEPIFRPAAAGEKDLARPILIYTVLLNYYYKAKIKCRNMKRVLDHTVNGPTLRGITSHLQSNRNPSRTVSLALHFLLTRRRVTEPQLLSCLSHLDDELRKRLVNDTPRKNEIYRTVSEHNALFRVSVYTTREALYLYESNLKKLNTECTHTMKLLCDHTISHLSILNDLSFLISTRLMILTFQRNIRILAAYLKHHLHNLSLLTYLAYLQFPAQLREPYLQVAESLHKSVMSDDDAYMYRSETDLFNFWRALKRLDTIVCTNLVSCALRQAALGTDHGQTMAEYITRNPLFREPHDVPFQVRKLVTRNLCIPQFCHLPTYQHTPVEFYFPPMTMLQKLFGITQRSENDLEYTHMSSMLKNFIVTQSVYLEDRSPNHEIVHHF